MSKPQGFFARLRAFFAGPAAPAPAAHHQTPPRRRTHRKAPGAGIDYVTYMFGGTYEPKGAHMGVQL